MLEDLFTQTIDGFHHGYELLVVRAIRILEETTFKITSELMGQWIVLVSINFILKVVWKDHCWPGNRLLSGFAVVMGGLQVVLDAVLL